MWISFVKRLAALLLQFVADIFTLSYKWKDLKLCAASAWQMIFIGMFFVAEMHFKALRYFLRARAVWSNFFYHFMFDDHRAHGNLKQVMYKPNCCRGDLCKSLPHIPTNQRDFWSYTLKLYSLKFTPNTSSLIQQFNELLIYIYGKKIINIVCKRKIFKNQRHFWATSNSHFIILVLKVNGLYDCITIIRIKNLKIFMTRFSNMLNFSEYWTKLGALSYIDFLVERAMYIFIKTPKKQELNTAPKKKKKQNKVKMVNSSHFCYL